MTDTRTELYWNLASSPSQHTHGGYGLGSIRLFEYAGEFLMPKALTIFGLVVAGLLVLIFGMDLALGIPFGGPSMAMDICFLVAAVVLAYMSWSAFREAV